MNRDKITVKGVRMFMGDIRWQVWHDDRLFGNYVSWENAVRFAFRMAHQGRCS
jgi:hypothetical protein